MGVESATFRTAGPDSADERMPLPIGSSEPRCSKLTVRDGKCATHSSAEVGHYFNRGRFLSRKDSG